MTEIAGQTTTYRYLEGKLLEKIGVTEDCVTIWRPKFAIHPETGAVICPQAGEEAAK